MENKKCIICGNKIPYLNYMNYNKISKRNYYHVGCVLEYEDKNKFERLFLKLVYKVKVFFISIKRGFKK
ncbi:hypothetical protein M0R19_05025 [Candidatus Pacearchaeota archaeon]|nr:hypothetical protein [Candidatus Pacearchaeota archaeon]